MISVDDIKDHMSYYGYEFESVDDNVSLFKNDELPSFIALIRGDIFSQRFPFGVNKEKDKLTILEQINKQNILRFGSLSYKEEEDSIIIDYYYFGEYDKKTFSKLIEFQKTEISNIVNDIRDILS
jgi:hypothetical protein